jgi:aminoglycoside phosphotransferase (APT) family kinase protein
LTPAAVAESVGHDVAAQLKQSQVAHYLVSLGLVNPRAVLEEDLIVTDVSRRNSVFLATTSSGPTYVIKQAGADTLQTLASEAAVLHALERMPEVARLAPELAHYDPRAVRLVLRSPAGTLPWGEQRRIPRLGARALGHALATIHAASPGVGASAAGVEHLWGLSLPEPSLERVRDLSGGALDLLARLQASRELCDRLRRLREEPAGGGFVHGDLRWDNCMATAAPGARRRTRVLLIDWELAGPGEPAADVGAALAEYLRQWVGSIPIVDPAEPGRLAGGARYPLDAMKPAMRAFWEAYRRARPVAVRRVAELTGVRLLQTAFEHAQGLTIVTAHVIALLQLADNVLRTPEQAAWTLMGVRE